MKKIVCISWLLLFVFNTTFGQQSLGKNQSQSKYQVLAGKTNISQISAHSFPKNIGNAPKAFTTLLTQDFSSTTFPPTGWTIGHNSGTSMDWVRGIGPQTYSTFSNIGTTASNGYAFVNSDGLGSNGVLENCWLKTPAIDCTGKSYVWLKFNEFFRRFNTIPAPTGDVEVSNNGTTWTTVHSAQTGIPAGGATTNPKFVDVDISSIAANQGSVYVRFHWTGSWDYYWFVDDVEVYSRSQFDATLISRGNMNEYSTVPLVHYNNSSLALNATVKNVGGSTITAVNMGSKVYNGDTWAVLNTQTSNTLSNLAANATGTLTASNYSIPAGLGFYVSEYISSTGAQTDADIHNDSIYQGFWIDDSLYARDDVVFFAMLDGSLGLTSQAGIFGQNYTFAVNDKLKHIECYVTGAQTGDQTQFVIYSTTNGLPTTELASSALYTFTTTAAQWVDLPISGGPFSVTAGTTYFIGIKQISTTHNLGVGYTYNNYTANKVYAKIATDPWDTLNALGYNIAFVIRPYLVCGTYKPTISAPESYLCTGDQLTLTASPGTSYLWSAGSQSTPSINITTSGSYTVTVTNNNGCTATSNAFNVAEYAKPIVNLGHDTTVCTGITLNAGNGYTSYVWAGGSSSNQNLAVNSSGFYSVTVSNNHNCTDRDTIYVTVNQNPVVYLGSDITICANQSINLDAGGPYNSYQWSSTTLTTQQITVDSTGTGIGVKTVYVTVTNNGCTETDFINITFDPCTEMDDFDAPAISLYPNPTSNYIYLQTENNFEGELNIINVYGQLMYSVKVDIFYPEKIKINLTGFQNGLYYVLLKNDKIHSSKFILE